MRLRSIIIILMMVALQTGRPQNISVPAGTACMRACALSTSLPEWANRSIPVIKRAMDETPRVVHILCIGNSFSADIVESWLSPMARKDGIELVIGNAVWASYGPREYWQDLADGIATTEYRKIKNGTYTLTSGHTLTELIEDEPWDIITFQQNCRYSGIYSTYTPYLQNLIDYVKGIRPQAKLGWMMTWTYSQDARISGFGNYNYDQMTMFNAILDATAHVMQDHPDLDFMVPCGTAIQNLRSSFLGDRMNRDGAHLRMTFARYATAFTLYATLFGEEMAAQNTYKSALQMNDFIMSVTRKAALDAVRDPYSLTPQEYPQYTGENNFVPSNIKLNFTGYTSETPGWNNISPNYEITAGLKDIDGNDPGIFIWNDKGFSGSNSSGLTSRTWLDMPAKVSWTALYGYSEGNYLNLPQSPVSVMHFHHLNKLVRYDFSFFSSQLQRTGTDDNIEVQFVLNGADTHTATLSAENNSDRIITINDVMPDENGTITLSVSAGPNNNNPNKLYAINALRISAFDPTDPNGIASPQTSPRGKGFKKIIKNKHLYIIQNNEIYSIDGRNANDIKKK